jgi:hypothetical protein
MALAASAWVTTEQESTLPVAAAVIFVAAGSLVVAEDTDPLAVGAGPDDLEEDEPHAASRMVMKQARAILTPPGPSLIGLLDRITWK